MSYQSLIVEISKGIKGDDGTGGKYKTHVLSGSDFAGSPQKATILFDDPYDVNYVPLTPIGLLDARLWTVESVTLDGYTINSNSDDAITGLIYCATLPLGEST